MRRGYTESTWTMMAFSYKYGFISRGLIGTIYQGLDKILPVNMMTYQACVGYTLVITMLFMQRCWGSLSCV